MSCPSAYSICPGRVVAVGTCGHKYAVSVLVNNSQLIRYTNLSNVEVVLNQILTYDEKIGNCFSISDDDCTRAVMFEYCTSAQESSIWPVRIGKRTFYKHNPITLFNGTEQLVVLSSKED